MTQVLTKRENEVAELIAWGASKKEIADRLKISVYTVDSIVTKIYEKLKIGKINELSAWWFCTHFNISLDLSPIKRKVGALAMVLILLFAEFAIDGDYCRRARRIRSRARTEIVARRAKE